MDPATSDYDSRKEAVVLVGVQRGRQPLEEVKDSLEELAQLAETAGADVVDQMIFRQDTPHPGHYIGIGKVEDVATRSALYGSATVLFDDDLSPAQGRNLEKLVKSKVIDRTQMILDIFAQHALTKEGRLQVELAQLVYWLPRLRRMWTHLERQKGGIGMHGPGESQLEVDRRRIQERITRLRKELKEVRRHRGELRRGRRRHGWALVSLVGYTNAGKSSLLNALTGAAVKAIDQLFATLDPTTRQIRLPDNQPVLLTDTVGFIRKLPHGLVESFKATLEEVAESDLLIHVIDTSHPQMELQRKAVHAVLDEIGAGNKPIVSVFNKIDMTDGKNAWRALKQTELASIPVSAKTGEGLDVLLQELSDRFRDRTVRMSLQIPAEDGKTIATLHGSANVLSERYEGDYAVVDAYIPVRLRALFDPYECKR